MWQAAAQIWAGVNFPVLLMNSDSGKQKEAPKILDDIGSLAKLAVEQTQILLILHLGSIINSTKA